MSSAGEAAAPGAIHVTRQGWMAYALAAAVLVLDQLSKFWVLEILDLDNRSGIEVLPIFSLTMVKNEGVSFGLFRADSDAWRWVLVAFAAVIVLALIWWAGRQTRRLPALALGLIIGGAVGNNLIDRVRFGWVTDFFDFSALRIGPLHFPWIFNVADSAITIGVVLLLLDSFFHKEKGET